MTFDRLPIINSDPGQVGLSLGLLGEQLQDGWRQLRRVTLPKSYTDICQIVVCGMGGSHLGADIVRSVAADVLPGPITIVADYTIPAWVDQWTLVICSSYSGQTEETLSALKQARARRAKVVVMTAGGALASAARQAKYPLYLFVPSANPSGQPRLGLGYSLAAMIACLRQLAWLRRADPLVSELALAASSAARRYGPQRSLPQNPAKQLAASWREKIPLLIGADWMAGNLHTWANQIHENAKTYAAWYMLPDLNHHLLEGLRHRRVTKQFQALFVRDEDTSARTKARYRITGSILKSLGAASDDFRPRGETRWSRAIDLLAFGGYSSWYLAAARNIKPASIPTVDSLKQALARIR